MLNCKFWKMCSNLYSFICPNHENLIATKKTKNKNKNAVGKIMASSGWSGMISKIKVGVT